MGHVQISNFTFFDRHPTVFEHCADHVVGKGWKRPRVLSVGCSTGDELLTLRHYFPDALITGIDIVPENIEESRRRIGEDADTTILCGDPLGHPEILRPKGPFQVIFANSVLCVWPASRLVWSIEEIYPFREFESHVQALDSLLEVGGLLVIVDSNFCFHDTACASRYMAHDDERVRKSGNVHKFDKRNRNLELRKMTPWRFVRIVWDFLTPFATALFVGRERSSRAFELKMLDWSFYKSCVFEKKR